MTTNFKRNRNPSIVSMDDYCLDRLFDPEELYYTPMDELLKRYAKRNLRPGRMFNLAKRYGHVIPSRKRTIIAPPMNKRNFENMEKPVNNSIKTPLMKLNAEKNSKSIEDCDDSQIDDQKTKDDKQWLSERKNLRTGLNNLELKSEYLNKKKNLSESERRVLNALEIEENKYRETPEERRRQMERYKYDEKSSYLVSDIISESGNDSGSSVVKLPMIIGHESEDKNSSFKLNLVDTNDEVVKHPLISAEMNNQYIYDKKAEINNYNEKCVEKAIKLNISDPMILRNSIILPRESNPDSLIQDMKEKSTKEKQEKRYQRFIQKRERMLRKFNATAD